MSSLSFGYAHGQRLVLADATLSVASGEKVLIEGPSGSGKTTLAKLIAGELQPTSGTSLMHGLDVFALSQPEWRRRVASSPQFHENHIFTNTFAFNLEPRASWGGMGQAATEICGELGLATVLQKMPQGTSQLLGEVGWQLSHGEQSRLFIARSLLQGADIMLFDESFAALDPETLAQTVACVRRRAKTLIVIAHT
jgi:ATP-binding cassette subfamily B protein